MKSLQNIFIFLLHLQTYSSSCSVDYHQESLQLLLNDYFSEFVAVQFKVFFSMSIAEKIWKEFRPEKDSKIFSIYICVITYPFLHKKDKHPRVYLSVLLGSKICLFLLINFKSLYHEFFKSLYQKFVHYSKLYDLSVSK